MYIKGIYKNKRIFAEISIAQFYGEEPRIVPVTEEINGEVIVYDASLDEIQELEVE